MVHELGNESLKDLVMTSSVMAPSQEDLKSLTLLMASAKLRPGESQEEDLTEIELHPWLRTPPEHGESYDNDNDSGVDSNNDDDEDSVAMNELRPDEEVLTVVPERFEDGELVPGLIQMRKKQPSSDPTARSRNTSQVEDQAANTLLETVGEFEDHHAPMGSTPLGQLPEPDPMSKRKTSFTSSRSTVTPASSGQETNHRICSCNTWRLTTRRRQLTHLHKNFWNKPSSCHIKKTVPESEQRSWKWSTNTECSGHGVAS